MSREIKFRGKDIQSGEWRYGYVEYNYDKSMARIVSPLHIDMDSFPSQFFKVDIGTISQFTGLLDKNGKEIYEGDIVRFYRIETCGDGWNEPREQWIKEIVGEVVYNFGMFHVETEEVPFTAPISWEGINSLKDAIEEFGLENAEEDEMVDYKGTKIDEHIVGVEVIGNVFDNPELLEE